jgi:uncharacterized membrane protein YfcA
MDTTTIFILLIVFIATLIRSTFGFGESLIAVPLLILFIPIEIAVPFSVLLSVSIASVIVSQDRKQIHFISAKWLVIFAIPGIPLGLFILIYGNEHFVKSGLGLIIILYAFYSLIGKRKIRLKKDSLFWLFICGFFSEFLAVPMALTARLLLFMEICAPGLRNISELLCKLIFYRPALLVCFVIGARDSGPIR